MFAKRQIVFGDNPLMRWFTNNVAVTMQLDGSKNILKDEVRRKTDGFHAMLHSLYRADELLEYDQPFIMADISFKLGGDYYFDFDRILGRNEAIEFSYDFELLRDKSHKAYIKSGL